jgi:hypothetical protein
MKTPVEIFDEWVINNKLEPRFHPIPPQIAIPFENQRMAFDRRIKILTSMFRDKRNIEIYVDFFDDGTCDAVADIHGCMGLIGVNKGAVLLPVEMFHRMLTHPLVMPGIGDARSERIGPQHREGMPRDYDSLIKDRQKAKRSPFPKRPVDPQRQRVSQNCMEIVWSFVAIHELVHIVHGHIRYIRAVRGLSCVLGGLKSFKTTELSQDDLDFQAIELAADRTAASVVLNTILNKNNAPELHSLFPNPEDKIRLWSFAMYTLFRIWGLEIDPANLRGHTHPPALIRYEMVMANAHIDISRKLPELDDRFVDLVKDGQEEAEKGIVYSGAKRISPEDIVGTHDDRVTSHLNALVNHLDNVISPKLQDYAYIQLNRIEP